MLHLIVERAMRRLNRCGVAIAIVTVLSGCAVTHLPANLGTALLDNDDIELVGEALPAYMVMMDAVVRTWPKDSQKLTQAAKLYSAYAGIYADDTERAQQLSQKALDYALRAACLDNKHFCDADTQPLSSFEAAIADAGKRDLAVLSTLGDVWAGWIQLNSGNWTAIAQLARVRMIMERVVAIDSGYDQGQAHMYLGVLDSLLPAALGGHPQEAKRQFQQAISLSSGNNLLAKVLYAKRYARLVGDQQLFNSLLDSVLDADPHVSGLTLQNVYAQQLARQLKDETDTQ